MLADGQAHTHTLTLPTGTDSTVVEQLPAEGGGEKGSKSRVQSLGYLTFNHDIIPRLSPRLHYNTERVRMTGFYLLASLIPRLYIQFQFFVACE